MKRNLIFVDCEARGRSAANGTMTEFGAVDFDSKKSFHGILFEGSPDPENPAIPIVGDRVTSDLAAATAFKAWLDEVSGGARVIFVSDNPAYDWQWIAAMFDRADMDNPFGHSARRISDFYAGIRGDFRKTQGWKHWRKTEHDHNPVNDAMGNVEAFEKMVQVYDAKM